MIDDSLSQSYGHICPPARVEGVVGDRCGVAVLKPLLCVWC